MLIAQTLAYFAERYGEEVVGIEVRHQDAGGEHQHHGPDGGAGALVDVGIDLYQEATEAATLPFYRV